MPLRQLILRSLALAGVAAVVACAPAAAALRWGSTETVTPREGYNVRVAIDARGDALAVWDERAAEGGPAVGYAWRPPRGEWTAPRRILGQAMLIGGSVPMTPDGTALLAYKSADGRVAVATARPGGAFGQPQYLTPPGRQTSPPTAVLDDEGNAIVGWAVWSNGSGSDIEIATRRAGKAFGEPQTLGSGGTGIPPQLAMSPSGAAAAGWSLSSGGRAHVSYKPPAGSFGPPERVPFENSFSASPVIAMNVLDELVVAESTSIPVGDGSGGTRFAVRSPLGTWGDQVVLDTGGFIEDVLAEPTGAVSFPFQRTDDSGGRTAYFATRLPGGALLGPDRISSPNSFGPRIAMNLRGELLGTWAPKFHPYGEGTEVAIAERPAAGRFGRETVLSTPDSIGSDAGINEARQAVVAWTHYVRTGEARQAIVQARVREDRTLPRLPFPPDVDLGPAPDVSLGGDGVLEVNPRCNESCVVSPTGLLHGTDQVVAGRGSRARLRARRARRVRVKFGGTAARLAREALADGHRPWVSISVTARGRSPRPVTVSRRVRLRR